MAYKSIIQDLAEHKCYVCSSTIGLQYHHFIGGTANRKLADKDGLGGYLCYECHLGNNGVHLKNTKLRHELQQIAQRAYEEKIGTRQDFIARYGRNYLD